MGTIYYDRETVKLIFEQWQRFWKVIETPRRLPRPWPMFCGQSLDNRPIIIKRFEEAK